MAYFEGSQAVEAMQAASEAAGWECEYRQVEAGELEAQTVFQPIGSLASFWMIDRVSNFWV